MTSARVSDDRMAVLIASLAVVKRHACPKPDIRTVLTAARERPRLADRIALYTRFCMFHQSPTAVVVDALLSGRGVRVYTIEEIAAMRDRLDFDRERIRPLLGRKFLHALESMEAWLAAERWRDIERAVERNGGRRDPEVERIAWETVREIKSIGRYMAIKLCWMLSEGEGWGDLTTMHAGEGFYIRKSCAHLAGLEDVEPSAADAIAYSVREAARDAGIEVTLFEVEALICETRQALAGRRYLVNTVDKEHACYRRLVANGHGALLSEWPRWREATVPARARGEIQGWKGPRLELNTLQRDTGVVWSDLDYDYAASAPPVMLANHPRNSEPPRPS